MSKSRHSWMRNTLTVTEVEILEGVEYASLPEKKNCKGHTM
jgi:hypothetical protein